MRIGIDIDDTLVNTKKLLKSCWTIYVYKHPSDKYTFELPDNINRFGDPYIDDFWNTYREEMMFPEFIEYAAFVTNRLILEGNQVYIMTARPDDKYPNLQERLREWFDTNDIHYTNVITNVKDKGEYCENHNIDLLIDDDYMQILSARIHGVDAICFDGTDWIDVYQCIKKRTLN